MRRRRRCAVRAPRLALHSEFGGPPRDRGGDCPREATPQPCESNRGRGVGLVLERLVLKRAVTQLAGADRDAPACCMTCASSCANSASPRLVPGWDSPGPSAMWWPMVNARASRPADNDAAVASKCTRTAEKSYPNTGSTRKRRPLSSVRPDPRCSSTAPTRLAPARGAGRTHAVDTHQAALQACSGVACGMAQRPDRPHPRVGSPVRVTGGQRLATFRRLGGAWSGHECSRAAGRAANRPARRFGAGWNIRTRQPNRRLAEFDQLDLHARTARIPALRGRSTKAQEARSGTAHLPPTR